MEKKIETRNQWNLNQEINRESQWNQSWFFETINKIDKPLGLTKKKRGQKLPTSEMKKGILLYIPGH